MYETFYHFKENPFRLTPDPSYVYMSGTHGEACTHLEYAVQENKGFVVITGEIGAGKTTLMHVLLQKIPKEVVTAVLTQTSLLPIEFLRRVCDEFEIKPTAPDKASLLDAFHDYLLNQYAAGRRVVLLIDEAQNLPVATLEELRMLSNLETQKEHLIQMILLGQPDLKAKLRRKGLEQFVQRVTVHYHLRSLDREETGAYIRHRLHVAGGDNPELFTPQAASRIFTASQGIPRLINILCDGALVYGYADGLTRIDEATVLQVIQEREGLGGLPHTPEENEEHGEAEMLERMSLLEARMERLGDLIEHQVAGQETREADLEKRFEQRVASLLSGQGARPAEAENEGAAAGVDTPPSEDRVEWRVEPARKEAEQPPLERQKTTGFIRRLLNRIGS